jgi:hypothetical protein
MANTNIPNSARAALAEAAQILDPHAGEDPRVAALAEQLQTMADSRDQEPEDDIYGRLAKSMIECEQIAKSEDLSPQTRERASCGRVRASKNHALAGLL